MSDELILNGKRYVTQERWSREKRINPRTTARHRDKGLPWLLWGGEVFIPEEDGDAYVASLVKRRNVRKQRS
jgi:hypothetical protein